MYFAMRIALARLGGIAASARVLGVEKTAVAAWVVPSRRTRPDEAVLHRLAEQSGVALESLLMYYQKLETYRENEYFRRRRPQ